MIRNRNEQSPRATLIGTGWRRERSPGALLLAAALTLATGCKGAASDDQKPMDGDPFGGLVDCKGVAIASDGALDVDVKTVRISGKVTLNGAVLPDATADRGTIQFVEKHTGTHASLALGTQGPGQYAALLAPAEYDISYVPNSAACKQPGNKLPCLGGVLKSSMKLSTGGALDLDLQTVTVAGKITVNGAPVPSAEQGMAAVSFTGKDGSALSTALTGTFLRDYNVVLLSGSYDIAYAPPASCSRTSTVPCVAGALKKALAITTSGAYDLDLPAVQVSGHITMNGQVPSPLDLAQGTLAFHPQGSDTAASDGLVLPMPLPQYQITLFSGTYDVRFVPLNPNCAGTMPCIAGTLKSAVGLTQSGALDIDIPSVQVQGNVTVGGQPADADGDKSTLVFVGADKSTLNTVSFGARRLSTYKVSLIPGVYQVQYAPAGGACSPTGHAPCISGSVKADVALKQSGELDLDVPVVTVTGRVTINGTAVAGEALTQGKVEFALKNGGSLRSPDLGPYALRVLPGSYAVNFASAAAGQPCSATALAPCNSGLIKDGVMLTQSGALDLDVGMVHASGRVTLDGMPMPDTHEDRGTLMFILGSSAASTQPLGPSGAASYKVALLKGAYKLAHIPNAVTCTADRQIPCVGQVTQGCD